VRAVSKRHRNTLQRPWGRDARGHRDPFIVIKCMRPKSRLRHHDRKTFKARFLLQHSTVVFVASPHVVSNPQVVRHTVKLGTKFATTQCSPTEHNAIFRFNDDCECIMCGWSSLFKEWTLCSLVVQITRGQAISKVSRSDTNKLCAHQWPRC
jgi:hypothetical protein